MAEYHGHMTMADGSHLPLSKDDADALWKSIKAGQKEMSEQMPTARDALRTINNAQQRLNDLGWSLGGGLKVRRGDECAVAESGSTGMWRGWVDQDGKYLHYADYCTDPRKAWLKPLADLTPEELAWMEECDRRESDARSAYLARNTEADDASDA